MTEAYQPVLTERGYDQITTEVAPAPTYYYAEDVPPAVPREEPERLPLPQHHGPPLPEVRLTTELSGAELLWPPHRLTTRGYSAGAPRPDHPLGP